MSGARLIIFSGLPASGKSTLAQLLAQKLGATYLRADTTEQALREVCGISEVEGQGYRLNYRIARENLLLGNTVITDSVNPWELTRKEWMNVAMESKVPFINIEIVCSDKSEHRRRAESRTESAPGVAAPTWEKILSVDFQPWDDVAISIDTAGKSAQESFAELLSNCCPELRK